MDLGTGDGRAVLARARREPAALVVGIDASSAGMAESSLRAAKPVRKGGLPNAWFVVAAAECPPPELAGIAAEVTVSLPWGSLLRGTLALEDAAAASAGIANLVAPGGRIRALVSIDARDRLDVPRPEQTPVAEIAATASSWARGLHAGRDRPAWWLELIRPAPPASRASA